MAMTKKQRAADEEAARCELIDWYGTRGRFEDQMRCMRDDGPDQSGRYGYRHYREELEWVVSIGKIVDAAPRLDAGQVVDLQRILFRRTSEVAQWKLEEERRAEVAEVDREREQVARAFASLNRR
jgi:hypothetical protein